MSETEDTKQGLIDAAEGDKAKGDATDKKADDTPKFTQADVDRLIKERLDRADKKAKEAADKAKKEAADKALADNAEWQKLAESRGKEVEGMASFKDKAERYEKALMTQLEKAREGLTPAALKLLDKLDPAEQLEFIAENRDELLPQEDKGKPANVGKYPPSGKSTMSKEEAEKGRREDTKIMSGFFG